MNTDKFELLKKRYIEGFCDSFEKHESFKWEAFKIFKENFDLENPDYPNMFQTCIGKLDQITSNGNGSPLRMLKGFSEKHHDFVKQCFNGLFDEKQELTVRLNEFISRMEKSETARAYFGKNHSLQNSRTAMLYLILKYPNKYYFYEFHHIKDVRNYLEITDYKFTSVSSRVPVSIDFSNYIKENLFADEKLVNEVKRVLKKNGYDEELTNLVVSDFIFYSYNYISELKKEEKEEKTACSYWLYAPGENAKKWEEFYNNNIIAIGWSNIGNIKNYSSQDDVQDALIDTFENSSNRINDAHALWDFCNVMKPGDIVYVKKGKRKIIGKGIIEGEYEFDDSRDDDYNHLRKVKWIKKGEWNHPNDAVTKTLTNITPYPDYCEKLDKIIEDELVFEETDETTYTKDNFLEKAYISEEDYDEIVRLLNKKYNVIFQGAPGVGKTYLAKRLVDSLVGTKNSKYCEIIQFHQSYSYEDFISGFKPTVDGGFEPTKGVFYNFCKRAELEPEETFYLIIDEINRGNLSKIFGEVFSLIEKDKRNSKIRLTYEEEPFSVPDNIRIIGLMNTADRSLAMIDYALRRRFAFYTLKPGFESNGFKKYLNEINNENLNRLISKVEQLNDEISNDSTLGEGYVIGHSFFCNLDRDSCNNVALKEIVDYEIIPLLKEYWFDETNKVDNWINELRGCIK